jgi:hypothetical protein
MLLMHFDEVAVLWAISYSMAVRNADHSPILSTHIVIAFEGKYGIWGGNQQYVYLDWRRFGDSNVFCRFTVRNITVNNAQTGVYSLWNWGWTYQGVTFNNCQVRFFDGAGAQTLTTTQVGFDISTGGLTESTQV